MALSDVEIWEALESGVLKIDPFPDITQVGPVSIDLHLGPIIHHFKPNPGHGVSVDLSRVKANDWVNYATREIDLRDCVDNKWTLDQGEFALVYTQEVVGLKGDICARVEGRSSLARFGLSVQNTAPTILPNWEGEITLELTNVGAVNLELKLDLLICQLIVERLGKPASATYKGSFQGPQHTAGRSSE